MPQMFPDDTGFIAVIPADDTSQDAQIGDTLAFDYDKKQFVIVDGTPVLRSRAAAVRQWIHLMLITHLDRFRVYEGTVFGHTGEQLIGMRQVPPGFIHSELAREIREACALCPAIDRADNFTFDRRDRLLHITFTVTLKETGEALEVSEIVG